MSKRYDATGRLRTAPVDPADENRVQCVVKFQAVAPATADTLLSLVKQLAGVDAGGATTIAVTAGKRLRITSIHFGIRAGAAEAAFGRMTLRHNPAGACVIGSPAKLALDVGLTAATADATDKIVLPIPEGLEFSGTDQIGVSLSAQAVTNIVSIALIGYEYTPGI
jgi:hypothetical protein